MARNLDRRDPDAAHAHQSAPYSLNATNAGDAALLGGCGGIVPNTSATTQTKLGQARFDNTAGTGTGSKVRSRRRRVFRGHQCFGLRVPRHRQLRDVRLRQHHGRYFKTRTAPVTSTRAMATLGQSAGSEMGAYFYDIGNSGFSYVGYGDYGIRASAILPAGTSRTGTARATAHRLRRHRHRSPWLHPGRIFRRDRGLSFQVAWNDIGIAANGSIGGGLFEDTDSTGWAYVGSGGTRSKDPAPCRSCKTTRRGKIASSSVRRQDEVAVYTRRIGRLTKVRRASPWARLSRSSRTPTSASRRTCATR